MDNHNYLALPVVLVLCAGWAVCTAAAAYGLGLIALGRGMWPTAGGKDPHDE